ncbi:MAG: hypothetical protein AB7O60_01015 [Variibacter sp.]
MNVIDFNNLERDAGGKPLHAFPHPALARDPGKWKPVFEQDNARTPGAAAGSIQRS